MGTILERKSVRRYLDRPVTLEQVKEVLEVARWSPSWRNGQPWRFILVDDLRVREALAGTLPEGNPGRPSLLAAPWAVAVIANPEESGVQDAKPYYLVDGGLVFASLMLAAKEKGLDTCFLGAVNEEAAREILGYPEPFRLIGLTPLGYGIEPEELKPRKEVADMTWHNGFGKGIE